MCVCGWRSPSVQPLFSDRMYFVNEVCQEVVDTQVLDLTVSFFQNRQVSTNLEKQLQHFASASIIFFMDIT
jgi:hypothetical protein